ncbi:hypothetical protein V6N11_040532 [Hibiscus sabdariffa]|uniref:Uncharacterized protein n=1 Tax=Hibiscus sabdariffa TaxID=183260 RepID=A0ABR2RHX0_9ROSI
MEAEDVRGRAKQSLDFGCVYYPVSLTNGPRQFAQSWDANPKGHVFPLFVQIRKFSADSFVQLLPTVANIEKLKGDSSQGDYNWNEEIDDEADDLQQDHPQNK